MHQLREADAREAFLALGSSPGDHAALAVQCAAGHHIGTVYRTPHGPLYAGVPWAHSHGDRDRHDAAHHGGHRDGLWMDWLLPDEAVTQDDPLPAGCECGTRSLSRTRLIEALASGEHRMIMD